MLGAEGGRVTDPEGPGNSPHEPGHKKGKQFVPYDIDAEGLCGDIVVPNRDPGPADLRSEQIGHDDHHESEKNGHEVVDLDFRIYHPGTDRYGPGGEGEGLAPAADLADILCQDKIDGDELGGHGGQDQIESLNLCRGEAE